MPYALLKYGRAARREKYGLTHVDTERSMMGDVLSLAGYSIRRGFLPSHAIDSSVSAALAPELSSPSRHRSRREGAVRYKGHDSRAATTIT